MPAYRLAGLWLTAALVLALFACASSKKGTPVVVRYSDAVRGCDFLGRLVSQTADEGTLSQGVLRRRVVEMGGDTLLLLPAGSAEAWNCRARQERIYFKSSFRPTPTPPFRPTTPRPTPGYVG